MKPSRRAFLESGLGLTGALLFGCDDEPVSGPSLLLTAACAERPAGASFLGSVPFINEGDAPLDTPLGVGLDGRLLTDLSTLTAVNLITPNRRFYVRTRHPDQLDPLAPWRIKVTGLVDTESELALEAILARERPLGTHLLECSGNSRNGHFGLLSAAEWHGVPLLELLDAIPRSAGATRVEISGFDRHSQPSANNHSTPGASWILSFDELSATGAFLATRMNGEPLAADHGAPLRLVVPGWYGCTCIKWVDAIAFVDESAPATSQMQEFASRTHQPAVFALARDYRPATIDAAAMPVRVERWQLPDGVAYRVTGIRWGGDQPLEALSIQYAGADWLPVALCPQRSDSRTWSLWNHWWRPNAPGDYTIQLRVDAPVVRQRRLDLGYYAREVHIDRV